MNPLSYINRGLIGEPMNWGVVFIAASVWLLIFHCLMQAFTAMQSGASAPAGPGVGVALPTQPMLTPVSPLAVTPSGDSYFDTAY